MPTDSAAHTPRPHPVQPVLMTQSLLFALTPLIPVPFVGDAIDTALGRAIARGAAASAGIALPKEQLEQLTDHASTPWWRELLSGLLLFPLRWLFRTALVVRQLKIGSDRVSTAYHRGYLLTYAAHAGHLHADAGRPAAQIRAAIEVALGDDLVSPLGAAWRGALRGVQGGGALHMLQALIAGVRKGGRSPGQVDAAVDAAAAQAAAQPGAGELLQRMGAAIGSLPAEHFDDLVRRYEEALNAPQA